jgi:hypothetical protein
MIQFFGNILDRNIGRCANCMRKAFLFAAFAWVLVFASAICGAASWVVTATIIAALCLSMLALAHISVFAFRVAKVEPAQDQTSVKPPAALSRRQFASEFARAAAFAALGTMLAAGANSAFAACDCSKCRSDQVCCKTAGGQCGCFPKGISC